MPVDLQWNDNLVDNLAESFYQANEVLGRAFQDEITAVKWPWPNPPLKRDIVDTGAAGLRGSYAGERAREGGNPAFDHSWNMEYAMAVHEGARFKRDSKWGQIWIAIWGKPQMPGRPWTKAPLQTGVLENAFERLARR